MESIALFLERQSLNAPEFAYQTVYNKDTSLRGRFTDEEKEYNGMMVDKQLKDEWLDSLNNIKDIEIRSSCAGHNKDRVTFVIFRTKSQDENYIKKVVKKLNKCPNTFASYNTGKGGMFRICVASNTYYKPNNKKWQDWWENITDCIKSSL